VSIESATLGYGRKVVLSDVTMHVDQGDFLGIVGPNGSGKTTLLKAILGLIRPMKGTVERNEGQLRIGYVPQRESVDSLYPLTVLDIAIMGRYRRMGPIALPGPVDRDLACRALEHVGIADLAQRLYPSLSGGQKQRALIARALVGEPNVLLLDEPTNGMDLPAEQALMELIRALHDADRITVLMVSHLLNVVVNFAQRIAIVGDGSVREGTVEETITGAELSALYGVPVTVAKVGHLRVVIPTSTEPKP
jgi:ABC-type Mn2+/Zn2+ transport system ATPase subunit